MAFNTAVYAQTPQPTATPVPEVIEEDNTVLRVTSNLVSVPVSVTDVNGNPVENLQISDFRLDEEGKAQKIEEIGKAEEVPLEIALLIDVSSSTDPMFNFEIDAASEFLKFVMKPQDRAAIYIIGDRPLRFQERDTAENSAVKIKQITPPTKQTFTAFYDAVSEAADYLNKNAPSTSRKVLITISDGEDTNSVAVSRSFSELYRSLGKKIDRIDPQELRRMTSERRNQAQVGEQNRVLRALQNADAVFYSINPAGNSYQLNKMSVFGQENMRKFADATGGTAFLPQLAPVITTDAAINAANVEKNKSILQKVFRQLTAELRAQYLIRYYSDIDALNGKFIKLNVALPNRQGLRVRARQGYFIKVQ